MEFVKNGWHFQQAYHVIQRAMKEMDSQGQEGPGKEEQGVFYLAKFPHLAWTGNQCDEWLKDVFRPSFAFFAHVSVYFTFLTLGHLICEMGSVIVPISYSYCKN